MNTETTVLYRHPNFGLVMELRRARVRSEVLVRTAERVFVKTMPTAALLANSRITYPHGYAEAFRRFTHPVLNIATVDPEVFFYSQPQENQIMAKKFVIKEDCSVVVASKKAADAIVADHPNGIIVGTVKDLDAVDPEFLTLVAEKLGVENTPAAIFAGLEAVDVKPAVAPAEPKADGPVKKAHAIFEEVHAAGGDRKQAMEKGLAAGINKGTLATQWQKFRVAKALSAAA